MGLMNQGGKRGTVVLYEMSRMTKKYVSVVQDIYEDREIVVSVTI